MSDHPNNEKDSALAAEYVLGLLSAEEHEAFTQRLGDEPGLQQTCDYWIEHFASLTDPINPVVPPAYIKERIEARLFAEAVNAEENAPKAQQPTRFWGSMRKPWFAGATAVLVMVLAVWLVIPPDFNPDYAAQLQTEDQGMTVTALYDLDEGQLQIQPVKKRAAKNGDYELWVIIGDDAPVSLGVLTLEDTQEIAVPPALVAAIASATLAISDEPVGGSPTGAPTGPVVAASTVQAI